MLKSQVSGHVTTCPGFLLDAIICCSVKWEQWPWLLSSGQRYYESQWPFGGQHGEDCARSQNTWALVPALLFSWFVIISVKIASEALSFLICEMGRLGFSKWDALPQLKTVSPSLVLLAICFSKAGPTIGSEKKELLENIVE